MKFVIATVALIAIASGVQSSIVGLGLGHGLDLGHGIGLGHGLALGHGLGLGHGVSHLGLGLAGQSLVQGPALLGAGIVSHAHLPAAVNVVSSPAVLGLGSHAAVVAPHAAVVAAPLAVSHGASYVAKTRGAVHTAPLPGHVHSAASVNVAPAPGTW